MGAGGRVSRRTLLGGAAAVAAAGLGGCAADGRSSTSQSAPSTLPVASTNAYQSAAASGSDRYIALAALKGESDALALYLGLARSNTAYRARLRRLIAVQRRHTKVLAAALGSSSRTPSDLPTPAGPVDAVVAEAQRLTASRFADSEQVESGALASMLASMAAAHRVVVAEWTAG